MLYDVEFSYLQSFGHLDGDYFIALFNFLLVEAVEAVIPLYFSVGFYFDIVSGSLLGNGVLAKLHLTKFEKLRAIVQRVLCGILFSINALFNPLEINLLKIWALHIIV